MSSNLKIFKALKTCCDHSCALQTNLLFFHNFFFQKMRLKSNKFSIHTKRCHPLPHVFLAQLLPAPKKWKLFFRFPLSFIQFLPLPSWHIKNFFNCFQKVFFLLFHGWISEGFRQTCQTYINVGPEQQIDSNHHLTNLFMQIIVFSNSYMCSKKGTGGMYAGKKRYQSHPLTFLFFACSFPFQSFDNDYLWLLLAHWLFFRSSAPFYCVYVFWEHPVT